MQSTPPISVLILTLNEENNLPGCLRSVSWSDDIHVVDSFSADQTLKVAEEAGAKIWQREFDSFTGQQNWALKTVEWKHPWVFYLDADERATPGLVDSMRQAIADPGENVGFKIRRRDFFMGRWLKHVQPSPYYIRLFRPDKMRYERLGHTVSKPDGPTAHIDGYLDHYPFSKGLDDWFQRHNFYSRQEAMESMTLDRRVKLLSFQKALFSKDFHTRREHQKTIFYKMPFRPLVKFLGLYIGKKGFLDGKPGLCYARLMWMYEQMIILKANEQRLLTDVPSINQPPSSPGL